MGSYHGKKSFETFSHRRSCLVRPLLNDESLKARYPPSLAKVRGGGGVGRGDSAPGPPGPTRDKGLTAPCVLFADDPSLKCCAWLASPHHTPAPRSCPRRIAPGASPCSPVDQCMPPTPIWSLTPPGLTSPSRHPLLDT